MSQQHIWKLWSEIRPGAVCFFVCRKTASLASIIAENPPANYFVIFTLTQNVYSLFFARPYNFFCVDFFFQRRINDIIDDLHTKNIKKIDSSCLIYYVNSWWINWLNTYELVGNCIKRIYKTRDLFSIRERERKKNISFKGVVWNCKNVQK